MLALVSPAKKLDFEQAAPLSAHTQPDFLDDTAALAGILKDMPASRLKALMGLSDKLAELNYNRYRHFSLPFAPDNAKQAAYAFRGDTYVGLDADSLSEKDMDYAQDHLRILSGLYGMLRPLDLMQPYRLEMGTKLANDNGEDLYDFWGDKLTRACNAAVEGHKDKAVICLASNEYIKAVQPKDLTGDFITCHFKEVKDGAAKVIGLFAKRARGAMARYMIENRIETREGLKGFDKDGYAFAPDLSSARDYVFLRDRA